MGYPQRFHTLIHRFIHRRVGVRMPSQTAMRVSNLLRKVEK